VKAAPTRRAAPVRVAIALGSNLGHRRGHMTWAVRRLCALLSDCRVSPFETTTPVDVPDSQPDYLNAVAIGRTPLSPGALLKTLLSLERERGRVRRGRKSARTLDLDLILYGDRVIDAPGLSVPHPRFRDRAFVLGPLAALAPRWRDPVTGRTLAALWRSHKAAARQN
jgi:2-amino-4-hydroxy-6-hydroxymethyldihydropteridine diphosphokinase